MFLIFALLTLNINAEPIDIHYKTGVAPTFGLSPMMIKTVEHANATQNKYRFVLEFKPGANGMLAVKALDKDPAHSIVGVGPHFLKHLVEEKIKKEDYVPVENAGYDICTGVITNVGKTEQGLDSLESMRGKEVRVGTLSPASPAYLTAVELSKRYGFIPKFVGYKSDDEGFLAIVGNHGINFAFSPPKKFAKFKTENPNLQLLAVHCPKRMPDVPDIKTLAEHGIHLPPIFNLFVAKKEMSASMRKEIGQILANSQDAVNLWKTIPHLIKPDSANWQVNRLREQEQFMLSAKNSPNG